MVDPPRAAAESGQPDSSILHVMLEPVNSEGVNVDQSAAASGDYAQVFLN